MVKQGRRTFEAIVDISTSKLAGWKEIRGVEPNVIQEEQDGIEEQLKHNAEWLAAIHRRGITDLDTVGCDGDSRRAISIRRKKGRRLLRVTCANKGAMHLHGTAHREAWSSFGTEGRQVVRVIDTRGSHPARSTPITMRIRGQAPGCRVRSNSPAAGAGFRVEGHG